MSIKVVSGLAGVFLGCWATGASASAMKFGLPANCVPGESCFIQNFVDMDPSTGRRDPGCGNSTFDGHKGTDLRIRSLQEMVDGVAVLAMAKGTVLRSRDGVLDRLMRGEAGKMAVKGKECGNGLILDHGDGWTTQYCHMKRNSLIVKPGYRVQKGAKLGEIGISGKTQFPHVHVTVRYKGKLVDPMTGGRPGGECFSGPGLPATTLWDRKTAPKLTLDGTAMLEAGFAARPVSGPVIMSGIIPKLPDSNSGSFVLWTRMINLKKGDRIGFRVEGSQKLLIKNTTAALPKNQASWTGFAGMRRSLEPGQYVGEVALIRDRKVLLHRKVSLDIQ